MAARGNLASVPEGGSTDRWPKFRNEQGSGFDWNDRLFTDWRDGEVFNYGDWEAREMTDAMKDSGVRKIFNVLTLPRMASKSKIDKPTQGDDKGQTQYLNDFWDADPLSQDGCQDSLREINAQAMSNVAHKTAFFEKTFKINSKGQIVYDRVAFRPQSTCRIRRDPKNGALMGFSQEPYYLGAQIQRGIEPIKIDAEHAFVPIHGQRENPLFGTSDLEVALWAYRTKQKLMFLWFQFLEGVALPQVIVKAQQMTVAQDIASKIVRMKGSGVLPVETEGGPQSVSLDVLNRSGNGADQFRQALTYCDEIANDSAMAGFLNLTGTAKHGGSLALSKDASDFFVQSLEWANIEQADQTRRYLFAPLIRWNFGRGAGIPTYSFEPLSSEDKSDAITLMQSLMGNAQPGSLPAEFIGALAALVADALGMDSTNVESQFVEAGKKAAAAAAAKSAPMAGPGGQGIAQIAGATGVANKLVKDSGGLAAAQSRLAAKAAQAGRK